MNVLSDDGTTTTAQPLISMKSDLGLKWIGSLNFRPYSKKRFRVASKKKHCLRTTLLQHKHIVWMICCIGDHTIDDQCYRRIA